MKQLEIEFQGKGEVSGTTFKQLKKSEKAFLYELTDNETGQKRYEVFERKISKCGEVIISGQLVKYEEKEIYPKSNYFGIWAWCIPKYNRAVIKYNSLNSKIKK